MTDTCTVTQTNLLYTPGTNICSLNKKYENELLFNITNYGLWNHLPIYGDYVPIRDIISNEKQKWIKKYGNNSLSSFPSFIVTNHFGAFCMFSRDFFPIYFDVASYFGLNRILFILLESRSPWYFSTRQSVTGIPDIRLYKTIINNNNNSNNNNVLLGQYITSGRRSYNGFKYWLQRYTNLNNINNYSLLIPKPILHKNIKKNINYYKQNYQTINGQSRIDFDALNNYKYNLNTSSKNKIDASLLIQRTAIIEDEVIAYISTFLSLLLIIITIIHRLYKCRKFLTG